jgi:acetoacetate decarboxylase
MNFALKGYTLPLSPEGRSSVIDPPPWHFGGDVMQIIFKTDEARARELIPPPLEMGPEPGHAILWFVEWVSVSESNPDLCFINPERSIYRECLVMVQCSFNKEPGYIVPYIWVDNDFTLMRGFIQGFPKKLGRIYQTRLHDLNPRTGGLRAGAKLKGICQTHGEKIAEGSLLLTRQADPLELPGVKFYLMRHFPDIENPSKPLVHELVVSEVRDVRMDNIWAGDSDLAFFSSALEEVDALAPVELKGGFFHRMGLTITGGKVIHRY